MVAKRSDGFEYIMLTPGEGRLAEYYRERGFAVWPQKIQTRRRLYPGLHTLQSLWFAPKLRQAAVDVVLCNTFPAASRVGTACGRAKKPYAIFVREFIRNTPEHSRILSKAAMVLAVSRDVAGYLKDLAPPERTFVVYDHLDIGPLVERARQHKGSRKRLLPFNPTHPVVGYVGRITAYKQPDLFLRAIPAVLEREPDCRFAVVGASVERERDYEKGLHRLARELCVAHQVAFMGQRPDAVEIISELAVCCLTSSREPFPRTVLEAQALGCPVVASDTGGCPEMVQHGKTGLLFPVRERNAAQSLAEQVSHLLQDTGLARGLAARAQESVRTTFGSLAPVVELEARLRSLELLI
jgi:glycosyltransferase involved in cell wall biosynthesis